MKQSTHFPFSKLSMAVAGAPAFLAIPSQAQVLEEVIVTVQKRVESIQEIPLTVTVVDGEALQQFSNNNATDLASSVPGLEIETAPQGLSSPKICGLGSGVGAENMDQSVGLFIFAGRVVLVRG